VTAQQFEHDAAGEISHACYVASNGRRAARALGQWCRRFELAEPEFQVLWQLQVEATSGFDQTTMARRLAYSPAQVSATVERLRAQGWIVQQATEGDRRRNRWHLTETGGRLVAEMLSAVTELRSELLKVGGNAATSVQKEAA
jgi:DNA-binding MarR family transcriptional regulator